MGNNLTVFSVLGFTVQLLLLTTNLGLDILTVFNGNISTAIFIHELLLEPGHLLAHLGWFGGAGPFHGPSLSVNKFFLTDILQFVPADRLGVGDVLQNRLNAALVGDAVHTDELLYVLALHLPGGDVLHPSVTFVLHSSLNSVWQMTLLTVSVSVSSKTVVTSDLQLDLMLSVRN